MLNPAETSRSARAGYLLALSPATNPNAKTILFVFTTCPFASGGYKAECMPRIRKHVVIYTYTNTYEQNERIGWLSGDLVFIANCNLLEPVILQNARTFQVQLPYIVASAAGDGWRIT
jgi:hypothetical protein